MSLRSILANIWAKKSEKKSFIENELVNMGPGINLAERRETNNE